MDAYVARQPIFDLKKKIFGYKLLFRDQTAMYDPGIDGDVATSTVLSNSPHLCPHHIFERPFLAICLKMSYNVHEYIIINRY